MKIKFLIGAVFAALLSIVPARAQFVMGTLDSDGTMAANSNDRIPSQAAVVTYCAAHVPAYTTLTVTASTGTLTVTNAKTVTFLKTVTLTGTDGTTETFPSTSATIARTDAAQSGSLTLNAASSTIGFATGAGGTVTQITTRSTGVTVSKPCGYIQTDTTSLAHGVAATFTVTNTTVAIGDVVVVSIRSGQVNKETHAYVSAVAAGSFDITVFNGAASAAETGAILINFAVIKSVSA